MMMRMHGLGDGVFCFVIVQLTAERFCCACRLVQLVYEKEKGLRMMMRMHGLGDGAYWLVMYSWFLLLYVVYMALFVLVGSLMGLSMLRKNSYGESSQHCVCTFLVRACGLLVMNSWCTSITWWPVFWLACCARRATTAMVYNQTFTRTCLVHLLRLFGKDIIANAFILSCFSEAA
jgi:hypothetical protein